MVAPAAISLLKLPFADFSEFGCERPLFRPLGYQISRFSNFCLEIGCHWLLVKYTYGLYFPYGYVAPPYDSTRLLCLKVRVLWLRIRPRSSFSKLHAESLQKLTLSRLPCFLYCFQPVQEDKSKEDNEDSYQHPRPFSNKIPVLVFDGLEDVHLGVCQFQHHVYSFELAFFLESAHLCFTK